MQNKNSNSTFGIDINEYTESVDFSVVQSKVDFIYLRASGSGSGTFRVDKKFLAFANACREYGIPSGGYHYAQPSYNILGANAQCDDFIETLQKGYGKGDCGDLMPVLDVEVPNDPLMNANVLLKWIDNFRVRFEQKTRRKLMIYTSTAFITENNDFKLSNGTYPLDNMPLWVAMYTAIPGNPPYPNTVGNWNLWRVWQFSEKQQVEGVGNPVDANWGPDNIALLMQPGKVVNFSASVQKGYIYLNWSKNKDVDLLGYNIFVDNYWIGTVDEGATSYKIPVQKIYKPYGRTVVVSIEAFDREGNTSQVRSKITLNL